MAPIKLYWWADTPNFGDRISREIVSHMSNREVVWTAPRNSELFAVGSILIFARRAFSQPRHGARPFIWGTGTARPLRADFLKNVEISALRGPITASLLNLPSLPFGDPGLLTPALFAELPEQDDKIGVVLHHSQKAESDLLHRIAADGRFVMIDPTDPDHMKTVARIAACRHVISSSLHGLVVADAFGVPNSWIDPMGIHSSARMKFYDYALGVGRLLGDPIPITGIFELADNLPGRSASLPYENGLAAAKLALRKSFPDSLKDQEKTD